MNSSKVFRRIVLATDGSDEAEAAVDAAVALSHGSSAEVRVVNVWNLEIHHRHGHWDLEVRNEAKQLLNSTVQRLTRDAVRAEGAILRADSDHIAAEVAIHAKTFGADLLVIGSRGHSNWQSMLKQSVSRQLLSAVGCPVMIVRGRPSTATGTRRVLLAVAGDDEIGAAAHAAIAAASAPKSLVLVVHAADLLARGNGLSSSAPDHEIQPTVAKAINLIEDAGISARGVVTHPGPVADVIARVADTWDVDVIVAGSSRLGDLASMLLGSVSPDLLHASMRPAVIAEPVLS